MHLLRWHIRLWWERTCREAATQTEHYVAQRAGTGSHPCRPTNSSIDAVHQSQLTKSLRHFAAEAFPVRRSKKLLNVDHAAA